MRYHHVVCMLIDMDKWLFRYLRKINDNVYCIRFVITTSRHFSFLQFSRNSRKDKIQAI